MYKNVYCTIVYNYKVRKLYTLLTSINRGITLKMCSDLESGACQVIFASP